MLMVTVSLLVLFVVSVWLYGRHKYSYWAKRGILTPPITPLLGHLDRIGSTKQGRWMFDIEVYQKYSRNGLAGGYMMLSPFLYVCEPEMIRSIFIKDFDHFTDRQVFKSPNKKDQCMNDMLTNVNGEQWKKLRAIMSPTFTSGKMKNLFHLVCEKADALVAYSLAESTKKPFLNMKHNFGRFTIDTIASCAFGVECNSLVDENAEFPKKADPFFEIGFFRMIIFLMFGIAPKLFSILGLSLFPKETQFFKNVVEETLAARRKGTKRGDFLDLLLEAQSGEDLGDPSKKKVLEDDTIIAQCVLFIIAGYDTSSTTLAFAAYELAKNSDKQQLLREEIQDAISQNNGMTYQAIMESKYLEACISETLRKYPPAPMLERICSKDYRIPGTDLTVPKALSVQVPVYAIHHDEKFWPEPEVFKPERFLPENKNDLTNYTYMPFGLGPRNCLAMRFAQMEAKVALAKLVLAAELTLAPGHEELVLSTGFALLKPQKVNLVLNPLNEE
ncbi:cytochrome P450 3A41-like [Palaemon carinicauda]|uniref:cytochrome P450 3A41-like n=1 Tax=Palaemon carinicauda TaxID=392227 RepID=UPI0035B67C72